MANGKIKAVAISIEQRVHENQTMEKVAGGHGILSIKISD
jgi:hypothetical protein